MSGSPSYLTIPHAIYQCYELDDGERFMLALLAYKDQPEYGCTEDNEWFAHECGISERTVKRRILKYKQMGFINVKLTGRGRIMTIADDFDDLLRGGRNRVRERPERPSVGPKVPTSGAKLSSQRGHSGTSHPYRKESGKELKEIKNGKHAPNGAAEPKRRRNLPALDEIPADILAEAETRVMGRTPHPTHGTLAWKDMVRTEAAALMEEAR